ncbi:hypothetical protein GGR57DRAFT_298661 [Xylariaceae sp. FL1272]|nr:hypothetical protein GGR57DRAFT_298661 [Xylariaceae sp. FL1272]
MHIPAEMAACLIMRGAAVVWSRWCGLWLLWLLCSSWNGYAALEKSHQSSENALLDDAVVGAEIAKHLPMYSYLSNVAGPWPFLDGILTSTYLKLAEPAGMGYPSKAHRSAGAYRQNSILQIRAVDVR